MLDTLVKYAKTDTEKVFEIMNWVHHQWQHNGENQPKKNDALLNSEEAKMAKNFDA